MPKMEWNNDTQCYELNVTSIGQTYKITIPSEDKKYCYFGNIKLNVGFKSYKLTNSQPSNVNINYNHTHHSNMDILQYDERNDDFTINTTSEGMLTNNNKTYTKTYSLQIPQSLGSSTRKFYVLSLQQISSSGDYTCKSSKTNSDYMLTMYMYINMYSSITMKYGSNSYTIYQDGAIYEKVDNAGIIRWYCRQSKNSTEIELGTGYTPILVNPAYNGPILELQVVLN